MTEIAMPRLSDSMEEGTIVTWLVGDGEPVASGDALVEIEADKAATTHPSEADGVLRHLVAAGETVAVGRPIARVEPVGASAAPSPVAVAAASPEPAAANGAHPPAAVRATPLARRAAARNGVSLEAIRGTGPRGRITRPDVLGPGIVEETRRTAPPRPAPAAARGAVPAGATVHEPSRLQALIARRMVESKTTIPHFQVQTEVAMDEAIALKERLAALVGAETPAPSINDLVIRACAIALRRHPRANGSWRDGRFVLHDAVHVGFAVAAEDALLVPVVRDADSRSLGQIAAETRRLAGHVRGGEIAPADLDGGTFTVSNLGMYGMTAITPVINPPQAAILGVGATRATLARVDGAIVDRALMTLTLSSDHRILYGVDAARFLAEIRTLLEQPLALVL